MLHRELQDVRRPLLHLLRPVGVQFVSATLVLSKLRIELGPLLRVWSVEFDRWCDDRAEVEIRGGNVESRERDGVHRRSRLLLSLDLVGLGELGAVVVAHRHGYGSGVIQEQSVTDLTRRGAV